MGLDLLAVGMIGDHRVADGLSTVGLTDVVTVAGLLHYVTLLNLAWTHFDLFVAYVILVLIRLHLVGLVA